jgi:UDP-3-O-[3-hydroxymyristoyl] N-acetylglucosamine deacetylase
MTLRPATDNTGVVFRRVDLDPAVDILAAADSVGDTMLGTSLVNGDTKVSTPRFLRLSI